MLLYHSGSDTYRLKEAASAALANARAEHGDGLRIASADLSEPDGIVKLERFIKYPSFFDTATCITVSHALDDADGSAAFLELLAQHEVHRRDDPTVLVQQDSSNISSSAAAKKCVAYLKKHAATQVEAEPLKGPVLARWVCDRCAARGCAIAPDAVREVSLRTAGDTWELAHELDKLCAYAHGGAIDLAAVQLLTPAEPEYDQWELSNSIASHDKRAVIAALWKSLERGTPEQLLIGTVASSLRTLLAVKDLASRGLAPAAIAKTAGLHPFVVSKTLRGATAYDASRLSQAHIGVALLDRHAKEGQADAVDGLFDIVLAL